MVTIYQSGDNSKLCSNLEKSPEERQREGAEVRQRVACESKKYLLNEIIYYHKLKAVVPYAMSSLRSAIRLLDAGGPTSGRLGGGQRLQCDTTSRTL